MPLRHPRLLGDGRVCRGHPDRPERVLEREVSNQDVVDLANSGSLVVRRVLEEAGDALGRALAIVGSLLDPGLIVVGGPLEGVGDLLLGPMRQSFARHALPGIVEGTTIITSPFDMPAEAVGALLLGLQVEPGTATVSIS